MEVYFILSSDLPCEFQVVVNEVVGLDPFDMFPQRLSPYYAATSTSDNQELFVECSLYQKCVQIGLPVRTAVKIFSKTTCTWEESLRIPVAINDFSDDVQIVCTVFSCNLELPPTREAGEKPGIWDRRRDPVPIGSVTLPLFDKHKTLRTGKQKLPLFAGVAGDGSIHSKTLFSDLPAELSRREKLLQRLERREKDVLPRVEWLDKLTDRKQKKIKRSTDTDFSPTNPHLILELQNFPHSVIFNERIPSRKTYRWRVKDCPLVKAQTHVIYDPLPPPNNISPAEALARRLARSGYQRELDKVRRPNNKEKKQLERILKNLSKAALDPDDVECLFTFRYYCMDKPKALTKFLSCVDWSNEPEVEEGLELMNKWARINWADSLELLSQRFKRQEVRDFAVSCLERSSDAEFYSFTMELVKALGYETTYPSKLSEFLIGRSMHGFKLFNWLYWNLKVDSIAQPDVYKNPFDDLCKYANDHNPDFMDEINRQEWLVSELIQLSKELGSRNRADAKKAYLQELIQQNGKLSHLLNFPHEVRLPTKPEVVISGIVPSKCIVFKSKLCPLMVCFRSGGDNFERVIWKCGDDLRQDQMVMQFIKLMDNMLKAENLDMQLTPYPVLATSPDTGFLEFVQDSNAIARILADYSNDIKQFLSTHNKKMKGQEMALKNFVKSCAGYCVITYLLGIGDRHLDNLLLTTSGRLVHIDFGYIFGEDPKKPFVPPMKICKEMIECMGGNQGFHYEEFRRNIILVYKCLRRNANVILNLIMLVSYGEEAFMQNAAGYVEEKFALDLEDSASEARILDLVEESVTALMPQVVEVFHKWATYWR